MPKLELHKLILALRADLRDGLHFDLAENRERFLGWLITSGVLEYRVVMEDARFAASLQQMGFGPGGSLSLLQHLVYLARPDVRTAFPLPEEYPRFRQWFYTNGLEEHGYWPFLGEREKLAVQAFPEPWQTRLRNVANRFSPVETVPIAQRPFGVNFIGYAFGQLGIGEDIRMAARALLAADVPFTILNFPPGADIPCNDRSMQAHVSADGPYAINIFCMTAEETGRFYAERGSAQFRTRYNIGYWPWELGKWPAAWEMLVELVDEVWVSTRHTYDALKPVCNKPLFVMPMAVELGQVEEFASTLAARRHFGLPEKATLFCFAFDLNSSLDRKNPQACVDAFLQAFPPQRFGEDKVGLVIKTNTPTRANAPWEKLKRQAALDARIHIIEGTLQRPELLALYKACDCYLALHRAEGFGRGLAEALQLGLHVICTGYSGNLDFCRPPEADLVRYSLVRVRKYQYVHTAGQSWAEPDVAHAATLMRGFAAKVRRSAGEREWPEFAPQTVGARYKERLLEIAESIASAADAV